jgi:RND family efflux transporter MFP subunit
MRRRSGLILLLLFVGGAIVAAWIWSRPRAVEVIRPTRGPAVDAVYATGTVEPTVEVPVAPRITGRITKLLADEGEVVKRGELLAQLESADLQAQVDQLQARYAYAKSQYERNAALHREGLVSPDALERSRTEMQAADAALKSAREQARYTRLFAPMAGRIIRRDGEVGELIPANQPIFHLGAHPLRITAEVDEEDIARVRTDQAVLIRADAFPDSVFRGHVETITPRGNPTTRTYRVRVTLEGQPPLHIGMTAEINIIIAERVNALLVPSSAISGGELWIIQNGRAERTRVQVGVVGPRRTEIRSGVAPDQWVISDPAGLKAGMRVRARARPPPLALPPNGAER